MVRLAVAVVVIVRVSTAKDAMGVRISEGVCLTVYPEKEILLDMDLFRACSSSRVGAKDYITLVSR